MTSPGHTSSPSLPAPLRRIRQAFQQEQPVMDILAELQPFWQTYLDQARSEVPGITIDSGGETVYLGALSPGCAACKAGEWDCIFITPRCNLHCPFCYNPLDTPPDSSPSAFGTTLEEISLNQARTHITGISFSGGEPFLEPQKLLEWVAWFRGQPARQYTWVYTNGLLAKPHLLKELGSLGLNEIRFDMAATGYTHPTVLRHLSEAAAAIPNVTVEIPVIPADAEKLLAALPEWISRGVRFLNLHELIYEPGTLSWSMPGERLPITLSDGHRTAIHPGSRGLTLTVMRKVARENLPLSINDCSTQSKLLQIRGRRRSLAPLSRLPHEKLVSADGLESYCVYQDERNYVFVHPDSLAQTMELHPTFQRVRLVRQAPLSLNSTPRWLAFQEC